MFSAYKLNKQSDNIQPWCTPFPTWKQSVVPCPVLTVASWTEYRFLRKQVRYSGIPISLRIFQFVVIHTVKGLVNKAKVDLFLELSSFFNNPTNVGNLISGSSAFSKSSLNIWKFKVYILLKPCLQNFKHYSLLACEMSTIVQQFQHSLALPFFGIGMKIDLFQFCGHCWIFQICWHIEYNTFTVAYFRIWNSSTGIPSPPLALFIVMLPKAHLTSHSRKSGSSWVITPSWSSGFWRSFLYSSAYSCYFFLISSASVRSIPFLFFVVLIFEWKILSVSLIFFSLSHFIVFLYFFALIS